MKLITWKYKIFLTVRIKIVFSLLRNESDIGHLQNTEEKEKKCKLTLQKLKSVYTTF